MRILTTVLVLLLSIPVLAQYDDGFPVNGYKYANYYTWTGAYWQKKLSFIPIYDSLGRKTIEYMLNNNADTTFKSVFYYTDTMTLLDSVYFYYSVDYGKTFGKSGSDKFIYLNGKPFKTQNGEDFYNGTTSDLNHGQKDSTIYDSTGNLISWGIFYKYFNDYSIREFYHRNSLGKVIYADLRNMFLTKSPDLGLQVLFDYSRRSFSYLNRKTREILTEKSSSGTWTPYTLLVYDSTVITGIEYVSAKKNYDIFPNPFQYTFQIPDLPTLNKAEIYSITGQQLNGFKYSKSGNTYIFSGLESAPPGIYILKIFTENEIMTSRVIKQ